MTTKGNDNYNYSSSKRCSRIEVNRTVLAVLQRIANEAVDRASKAGILRAHVVTDNPRLCSHLLQVFQTRPAI